MERKVIYSGFWKTTLTTENKEWYLPYSFLCTTRFCFRATPISHLHKWLTPNSICKLFADDTFIFSKVFSKHKSQRDPSNILFIISEWSFQWEMQFNSYPNKQANEFYYSRKTNTDDYIHINLNDITLFNCVNDKNT